MNIFMLAAALLLIIGLADIAIFIAQNHEALAAAHPADHPYLPSRPIHPA